MTGISHMLPLIVAGGLLISISFAVNIHANSPNMANTLAGRIFQIGNVAFSLFLPVLAGYIAYSIADRPGLAPGLVGGYLAGQIKTGFLGAILAGFLTGYLTRWLATHIRLPQTLAGLKPVLILPLLSTAAVGLTMFYVIGEPISWVMTQLTKFLGNMQGSSAAVLGIVLGLMMALDMGGPFNKVAYAFGVGLISSGVTGPMAAVMVAGMTPPLGLALATVLFRGRWLPEEHEAGKSACMLGSAVAGAISEAAGVRMIVPHGGILNAFVPGAVTHVAAWGLALVIGTVVTTGALFCHHRHGPGERSGADSGPAAGLTGPRASAAPPPQAECVELQLSESGANIAVAYGVRRSGAALGAAGADLLNLGVRRLTART